MNLESFGGLCRQFAGKVNEARGELTGDYFRSAAGRQAQIAGKVQQCRGADREASARQLQRFLRSHRDWLT